MHFFLTGEKGVGKSWVVRKTVAVTGLPPFGFLTRFSERGDALYMTAPSDAGAREDEGGSENRNEAREEKRDANRSGDLIAERREGRMVLLPEKFDAVSTALLREAERHPEGIILMDECGHLEKERVSFHEEIARCLDQDVPVLGVLRLNQPWHSFIIHHPKVRVITVTAENRDSLPGRIAESLRSGEKQGNSENSRKLSRRGNGYS